MALIDSAPYYYNDYYRKSSKPYSRDKRKEIIELKRRQHEILRKIREEIQMLRKQQPQKRVERSKAEQKSLLQLGKQFGIHYCIYKNRKFHIDSTSQSTFSQQ